MFCFVLFLFVCVFVLHRGRKEGGRENEATEEDEALGETQEARGWTLENRERHQRAEL